MIAKEGFEGDSCSSTEDLPTIWPAALHDNNNCSTEACSNDEASFVQAKLTTSSDYSSDKLHTIQQQKNEQEDRNRYRLYLLVLRCIAYPFNMYTQSATTVLPMRLTKSSYRTICDKAASCITDPKTDENFRFCLKWYYKSILNCQDVVTRATNGEFSLRELRYVFKVHAHRHLCRVNNDASNSIEETLHSWLSQFDVLLKVDSREWFSKRRASTLPRIGLLRNLECSTAENPDSFYRMFQEILGISPIEHHAIITEFQINNREEQEASLKRELKDRIEKASQPNAFSHLDFFSAEGRELFCTELVAQLKKSLKKADSSLSLTRSINHSPCHARRKKKSKLRTMLSEVSSESGEDIVIKANFSMKFQLKVIIHDAVDISGVSEGHMVYCEFQLVGASQQPLGTDEVVLSEDGRARFDTEGTFETASPVPALKLHLKLASKGIFKNDKILGKVLINPSPSISNMTEMIDMVSPDQKQAPRLRVTINMKIPSSMKRCGFLYAQGDGIFQEWKRRFFALVYHHKYLLCCYAVNRSSPKKILPLEGYTVDYSEATPTTQGHNDGLVQFVMVKEESKLHFGVKESNERFYWLQWLTRATGQSHKPSPPDATPNNEGGVMLDQLRQFANDSVSDATHHELFSKLYHVILDYRMKESVFSRGLFSPTQNYVLEEYCQRYGIRSVFLHLVTLSELVTREWAGQSCDPIMMLSSFSYCRMAVSGKVQDHLSVVTCQEHEMFHELCGKIEKLVHYKIEHFRSCFPFACPKSDLAITLKLFCSVTEVISAEEEMTNPSCNHSVINQVDNLLRRAALHSYQDLLHLLTAEDDDDKSLNTAQLIALAELSVEYMCELHDFFLPDFAQFSLAFKSHVEAFWSFLEVDITATLKELFLTDISSGEILKVFYMLNQYCLAQNLTLYNGFLFQKKLQELFLPVVVQYLTKLDADISSDLRLLFSIEKWPQECPCVTTIGACLEALNSIQQMVHELRWPEKDVNCHLKQRCLSICSRQLHYCTSSTMMQLDAVISDVIPQSFNMRLPQQAFSMLCSLSHLQEQGTKLLNLVDQEMVNYHGEVTSFMQEACQSAVNKISEKASLPLKFLLQQLSQYDASRRLSRFKKIFYFSSIPVEDYVKCLSVTLEDIVRYCYKHEVQQMLLQKWFELQCSLVEAWLKQRPNCSLCPDQYQTISIIMKCLYSRLLSSGMMEEQLGDLAVYNFIGDRVRMEYSCSELIFNKN